MIGKTLGHYRVGEQLGRGGMGEVYTADDLNLNRKVALKFLPEAFAGDPERMARFEREAKLLASLNHPNIAAIYGLEQAEGKRFIVMELVEGETLAQRLSKGALPIDEALAICRQIAEGLEAAHEKGVIHRDLKPANVMITEGEKVKILDFGLAKALSDETQNVDSSQSPTLTEAMTRPGIILGTAAYMSPEQAKGKTVDKRADIWAFGCILYECLTGKRAFEGETVTETLASVLTKDLDLEKVPARVRTLLRRCLEKDPKKRLRDIGEAMAWAESTPESAPVRGSRLAWLMAAVATLMFLAAAALAFLYFHRLPTVEAMRFHIAVPPMPSECSMAVSPDGHWVAFVAFASGSVPSLFVREIGAEMPRQIKGTEGASFPFWSPDSHSIGFSAGGRLKRVDVAGSPQRDICAVTKFGGGTWNKEGVILFSDWPVLNRVSAEGGVPTAVTTLDASRKGVLDYLPHFLPDGNNFLYVAFSGSTSANDVCLRSLDSSNYVRLLPGASMAVYAEPGYLLFQRERTLYARPFDAKKISFSGESVPLADNLLSNGAWGSSIFSASQNGMLIYRSGAIQTGSQFVWLGRDGKQLGIAGPEAGWGPGFDLSPNEKHIAGPRHDPATQSDDIWVIDSERNTTIRLTSGSWFHACAAWSPDGSRIAFSSNRRGNTDILVKKASGIGEEAPLGETEELEWVKDWSKDGQYIAYGTSSGGLYALPISGDGKPFPIVQSSASLNMPVFSYDGKWLAYNSQESGTWQVYVVSFPAADQKHPISTNGGAQPRWRRDGKELYYLDLDGKMMAVDIRAGEKLEPGIPRILFDTGLVIDPTNNQYEVTADGRRFLLLKPLSEANQIPITIAPNWTALLRKQK